MNMREATSLAEAPAPESDAMHMTYEEFLAWAGGDVRAEWDAASGEVILQMPPKDPHQTLVEFLYVVIRLFARIHDLGRLRVAPFELKAQPEGSSREPDVMFVAREHLDRWTTERIVGPADLVIEVVSDDSVHRDRVDKFDEYEAAGVSEYWLLDNRPGQRRARFYRLDEGGIYQMAPVGLDGIYRSKVLPGFWLRLDWLWEEQPNELRALAEIIGPDRIAEALRNAAA